MAGVVLPVHLRRILEEHRAGRFARVIDRWRVLELPADAEVWRYIGLAVAHRSRGDLAAAELRLTEAVAIEPENAVGHYFLGIVKLDLAELSRDWPDSRLPRPSVRLAGGTQPESSVSKTRSRYELEAEQSFRLAVRYAPHLRLARPLVPWEPVVQAPFPLPKPSAAPTLEEFLTAWDAAHFECDAHRRLHRASRQVHEVSQRPSVRSL